MTVSRCRINTKYFPFDKHTCGLLFTNENAPNIILIPMFDRVLMPAENEATNWKLIGTKQLAWPFQTETNRNLTHQPETVFDAELNGDFNINYLIMEFVYERNSGQLVNIWLIPCIAISLVSNAIYIVVPDSADRLGFLTTLSLALMILLSIVSNELPSSPTPDLEPLVNRLYMTSLALFGVQLTVILITDRFVVRLLLKLITSKVCCIIESKFVLG